ncbi:MAG: hypothetical protein ACYDEJ_03975 [Desulfitobacteriaceae bacterium]
MLTLLIGLISIVALVLVAYSDSFTGKGKSSHYFKDVQKPVGKKDRVAITPESMEYDEFWKKLNVLK